MRGASPSRCSPVDLTLSLSAALFPVVFCLSRLASRGVPGGLPISWSNPRWFRTLCLRDGSPLRAYLANVMSMPQTIADDVTVRRVDSGTHYLDLLEVGSLPTPFSTLL